MATTYDKGRRIRVIKPFTYRKHHISTGTIVSGKTYVTRYDNETYIGVRFDGMSYDVDVTFSQIEPIDGAH